MSDQDTFERILASLYDAMLEDGYWPATLALINTACGIKGNGLLIGGSSHNDPWVSSVGCRFEGERCEDLDRDYITTYYPIDERVPRILQLSDSHLAYIPDLYTPEELKTSSTYNELLSRAEGQNGLNVRLDGPDGSHIVWVTADPVAPGGWETPQLELIKRLLPHIRQFIRVRQALVGAEVLGASMADLLDTSRIGVVHLNRSGKIVEVNDRARAILRHDDGLSDRGGVLSARRTIDQARLEQILAATLSISSAPPVSGSMTVRRAFGLPPFVVHVKPVGVRERDYGISQVAALVLLIEPGRQSRLDPSLVAEALGLTPREGQVAVWLAQGLTVQDIAVTIGRTESAVHFHLNQTYQKLNISRQADLVRLVLSLAELG